MKGKINCKMLIKYSTFLIYQKLKIDFLWHKVDFYPERLNLMLNEMDNYGFDIARPCSIIN